MKNIFANQPEAKVFIVVWWWFLVLVGWMFLLVLVCSLREFTGIRKFKFFKFSPVLPRFITSKSLASSSLSTSYIFTEDKSVNKHINLKPRILRFLCGSRPCILCRL